MYSDYGDPSVSGSGGSSALGQRDRAWGALNLESMETDLLSCLELRGRSNTGRTGLPASLNGSVEDEEIMDAGPRGMSDGGRRWPREG